MDKFTLNRILNRIWELQNFVADKFPLNRMLNRIWELQNFAGERCLLNRILNQNLQFEPAIFWRPLKLHQYGSSLRNRVIIPSNDPGFPSHVTVAPESQDDSRSWLEILHI